MSAGKTLDTNSPYQPATGQARISLGLVAPALALRLGLRTLLAAAGRIEILFEATTLAEASALTEGLDILVLTTGAGSIAELSAVLSDLPAIKILFLVEEGLNPDHIRFLEGELRHGQRVWGLLPVEATAEELAAAIHALAEGLVIAAPGLIEPFLQMPQTTELEGEEMLIEPLTERETEVLQLLAQGLANKQIALQLGISEHTVKFHISGIYAKLGVANRTEAVRQGVRRGLILL